MKVGSSVFVDGASVGGFEFSDEAKPDAQQTIEELKQSYGITSYMVTGDNAVQATRIAPETYLRRQQLMRERFERMVAYAANGERCRSAVLESYFGADDPAPCGVCDICLARKRAAKAARDADAGVSPAAAPDDEALAEELLRRLAASPADPHTLATETACDPGRLTRLLRELLERGKIAADKTGILKINE